MEMDGDRKAGRLEVVIGSRKTEIRNQNSEIRNRETENWRKLVEFLLLFSVSRFPTPYIGFPPAVSPPLGLFGGR
jgi:hypothetical protein